MRPIDADALKDKAIDTDYMPTGKWLSLSDLEAAPTIEQKRGKWIKMSDRDGIYWACSECGEDIPKIARYDPQFDLFPRLDSIDRTNYCPHCGAKMDVPDNDAGKRNEE